MFWIYPAVIMAIEDEDDRGFMEQMYRRYSVQLVAMALKSIHDMTAAEEIMSDVFKALVDNIDTLRALTGGQRNNYIFATLRSKIADHTRAKARRDRYSFLTDANWMFDEIRSDEEIDDRLIREAEAQMLRQSMEKLRDRDRDLLRMKYFEMRTDAEIAGELGIAAASVRYYLTLARRALLEEMKKYDE